LRSNAVILLEEDAHPNAGGELIFRQADTPATQIRGCADAAVVADENRPVAEHARGEHRDADIGVVAARGLDGEARQRQLADIELRSTESTEKDLLGLEEHVNRIDSIDRYLPVQERSYPVIVARCDR